MKIKLAASPPKSAGIRRSPAAATTATIIAIVLVDAMFGAKLAVAQQVAYKASRGPRIYNALITTDQRLLPSQADPIVTPVFRPFPFFYNGWPDVYAAAAATPVSTRVVQQPATGAVATAAAGVPHELEAASDARVDDDQAAPPSAIKNNKPADTSVPDVPPPPLPVSRAGSAGEKDKKKPEEFPPAPLGFAF